MSLLDLFLWASAVGLWLYIGYRIIDAVADAYLSKRQQERTIAAEISGLKIDVSNLRFDVYRRIDALEKKKK